MYKLILTSFKMMLAWTALSLVLASFITVIDHSYVDYSYAAPIRDFYIQQALDRYFPLPSDARSLALGGSSDMNAFGGICTFLNPAGLGQLENLEISISAASQRINGNEFITNDSFEQIENRGYLLLAIPLGRTINSSPEYGALALGYSRYRGDTNDSISSTSDGHTRTIGYGYNLNPELNIGYTFTFYDDQLNSEFADLHSHARILHLFGFQYAISESTKLGSTFRLGLGQSDTEDFIRDSNGLSKPREYTGTLGVSSIYKNFRPSFSVTYGHIESSGNLADVSPQVVIGSSESGDFYSLRSGLEYSIYENFLARVGVRWSEILNYDFNRSDLSQLNGAVSGLGWSGGVGYILTKNNPDEAGIRIDYGFDYLTSADGQWQHKLSLTVPFT